jgi:hypothetical protein
MELQRELDQLREQIRDGFAGTHARLDALNGRVRENETAIAVLEDRGTRDPAARWGAGIAIAAGVAWEGVKRMFGQG